MGGGLRVRLACFCVLFSFWASAVAAQQLSLSGTVRDATGVVPGATVTLFSGDNQVATTTSGETGRYQFTGLASGSYEVTVQMTGFEPVVRAVALGANTPAVDVMLSVGRVTSTVTVNATVGRATASRLPVPNIDLPAQVSTIPEELIEQQGLNTLGDALRNVSGMQSMRWYGAYENYTLRGFHEPDRDGLNTMLIDGMRFFGNRTATQTNNIQAIEVLKGPNSILYGRGAVGGSINIVRKKPQAVRAADVMYRGGRFNTHQFAVDATGTVNGNARVLYRAGLGFEASEGWRDAGADRLNVSPAITFLIGDRAKLTAMQTFVRDRFDGDGGVPLAIVNRPAYRSDLNFRLPQDRVLLEDSQSQVFFNATISSGWEFRNSIQHQRSSDRYFVTEGVYGSPDSDEVSREPLDFHHIRRPIQNQTEVVGRVTGFGTHNLLFGYEFQRDKFRTEVTAGDDPECLCGYWYLTIPSMDIRTMRETLTTPLDLDDIERITFVNDRLHSGTVQDQIDISSQVKVNLGYRVDRYHRNVTRTGGLPFVPQEKRQTAHSYRVGLVYAPRFDQQFYVASSSSFTPVNTIPLNGEQLEPSTARNVEAGHRWQGWNGRVDTNVAVYHAVRSNIRLQQTALIADQVGEQRSKGVDLDVNTDLGGRTSLIVNYGFAAPRFNDPGQARHEDVPRFVPRHNMNLWLRKDFANGFHGAFGVRHLGQQFGNDTNTVVLDGYTLASGAIGFHARQWDWSLNAENLFNRDDYFFPGHFGNNAFPGPPINVTTTIRLRWN